MLKTIRHRRFLVDLQCFDFENSYYVVFDHISISLAQLVVSPPYPTEIELAAIIAQVNFNADIWI